MPSCSFPIPLSFALLLVVGCHLFSVLSPFLSSGRPKTSSFFFVSLPHRQLLCFSSHTSTLLHLFSLSGRSPRSPRTNSPLTPPFDELLLPFAYSLCGILWRTCRCSSWTSSPFLSFVLGPRTEPLYKLLLIFFSRPPLFIKESFLTPDDFLGCSLLGLFQTIILCSSLLFLINLVEWSRLPNMDQECVCKG